MIWHREYAHIAGHLLMRRSKLTGRSKGGCASVPISLSHTIGATCCRLLSSYRCRLPQDAGRTRCCSSHGLHGEEDRRSVSWRAAGLSRVQRLLSAGLFDLCATSTKQADRHRFFFWTFAQLVLEGSFGKQRARRRHFYDGDRRGGNQREAFVLFELCGCRQY